MKLALFHLMAVMSKLPMTEAQRYLPLLNAACEEFEITTYKRLTAFLAQVAHESGELRWWEEFWGPTTQQQKYEVPFMLARRLGNTQTGDGHRYRGRGPLMLTGRDNYRRYGARLQLDLEGNPDLAAQPQDGFRVACAFWHTPPSGKSFNTLADEDRFTKLTMELNGGLNGWPQRKRYFDAAREALKDGDT